MHPTPPGARAVTARDARLAAAVAGDRLALEELVAELLPRVRNLVRYLVRGDTEAEDFAQEAMVAILRGLPSHRGEGTLQSWSDRVAMRAAFGCLKHARRARNQLDAAPHLHAIPRPRPPPPGPPPPPPRRGPAPPPAGGRSPCSTASPTTSAIHWSCTTCSA